MGRRGRACFCASCKCGETTITADGTVTWISHTVADGVITRVENESPCITYYVDSVSGGGAESGTGTELDPWTNLNTVFSDTCISTICSGGSEGSVGCPMVKVLVKGTIDYAITNGGYSGYLDKLVIEPWDASTIEINITLTGISESYGVDNCDGCIWKNTNITLTGTHSGSCAMYGFYSCSNSIFNECTCTITCTSTDPGGSQQSIASGFYVCSSSAFDYCTCTADSNSPVLSLYSSAYSEGYRNCASSTFYACIANITSDSSYVCEGNGYMNSGSSTYNLCTSTTTTTTAGTYTTTACGVYNCPSSMFKDCTSTGTGNTTGGTGLGYGFNYCASSTFDTCTGNGYATGTNQKACGFYDNAGASFASCSASVRVCVGFGDCASFTCDV